jgi:hypothetical protein
VWNLILPGIALTALVGTFLAWRFIMRDPPGDEPPSRPLSRDARRPAGSGLGVLVAGLAIGWVVLYLAIIAWSAAIH